MARKLTPEEKEYSALRRSILNIVHHRANRTTRYGTDPQGLAKNYEITLARPLPTLAELNGDKRALRNALDRARAYTERTNGILVNLEKDMRARPRQANPGDTIRDNLNYHDVANAARALASEDRAYNNRVAYINKEYAKRAANIPESERLAPIEPRRRELYARTRKGVKSINDTHALNQMLPKRTRKEKDEIFVNNFFNGPVAQMRSDYKEALTEIRNQIGLEEFSKGLDSFITTQKAHDQFFMYRFWDSLGLNEDYYYVRLFITYMTGLETDEGDAGELIIDGKTVYDTGARNSLKNLDPAPHAHPRRTRKRKAKS